MIFNLITVKSRLEKIIDDKTHKKNENDAEFNAENTNGAERHPDRDDKRISK